MRSTPTASSLVERFKLKERGRERGRDGQPQTGQPTLDNVEMGVVGYCDELYAARRDEYHRHRSALVERMQPPPGDRGADSLVENTCKEMRDAVARERPELSGLARKAQEATGEVNGFKREEGRSAEAQYPESRILHWGILLALVVLETFVNGLFFGANVEGGLLAGTSYAVLISLVNVVVLGWLIAAMVRQMHHRDPRRRVGGFATLSVVAAVAVFWNLFVAHYREALPPDHPAPPDTALVATSPVTPSPIVQPPRADSARPSCWRGPDETHADREALCLFRASPFGLNGFQSYMLLLIGLAMCAAAAMDWFRTDDPYPGYGRRERHRRKTEERLHDDRRELLGELGELHDEAARKLRGGFRDPADERQLAVGAYNKLLTRHTDLRDFARDLEKSCGGALGIYRTANREARSTPEPRIWGDAWTSGWVLPQAPDRSELMGEAEAEQRSRRMHAALEEREKRLRECHDECRELVNEFTRLDPHDRAVPA